MKEYYKTETLYSAQTLFHNVSYGKSMIFMPLHIQCQITLFMVSIFIIFCSKKVDKGYDLRECPLVVMSPIRCILSQIVYNGDELCETII